MFIYNNIRYKNLAKLLKALKDDNKEKRYVIYLEKKKDINDFIISPKEV